MHAHLQFLNVGKPQPLVYGKGTVESGIVKTPVATATWLGKTGLAGDGQADLKNHGGPDKAVCVYAYEHYPYWEEQLNRALPLAAFGENFSTEGLLEADVCVGDMYRVGTATVQVSQPRQPCFKLGARHGFPKLVLWVQQTGLTGYYLRCLESGSVQLADGLQLLDRPIPEVTIAEANRVMHQDKGDVEGIRRLLAVPALSASWRRTLERRLDGRIEDPALRIEGPAT